MKFSKINSLFCDYHVKLEMCHKAVEVRGSAVSESVILLRHSDSEGLMKGPESNFRSSDGLSERR